MPVHADLLSSLTPPQAPKTLQQIYDDQDKLAQAQAQRDKVIQQAKDDAAVRAAFGAHSTPDGGVDFDGLLSDLGGKISPSAYTALQKTIDDHREKASQTVERELKNRKTKLDISLGLTDFATDPDSWGVVRPALIAADPDLANVLPEPWSDQIPELLQKAKGLGLTEKERQDQQFNTWKELQTLQRGTPEYLTKARTFLGQALSSEAPEHLDSAIDAFVAAGIPKVVADQFRGKTPEQAAQMAITPEKQAELDAQKAAQDRIESYQNEQQRIERERLAFEKQQKSSTGGASTADVQAKVDAIMKNPAIYKDLTPTEKDKLFVALSKAGFDFSKTVTQDGKPSTGVEKTALGYFNRAQNASKELEKTEDAIADAGTVSNLYREIAPNFMQSGQMQAYTAAQRAFTEARLRKDSGAAIPESEFKNDRQTYFVQPGDSKETVEQKKRARAALLASLAFQSGRALAEFYGDDANGLVENLKTQAKGGTSAASPASSLANTYTGEVRQAADGRFLGLVDGKPVELLKTGNVYVVKR